MLRIKKAKKLLTKKQQRHLTEMNINSMRQFIETRKYQAERRDEDGWGEPCFECRKIALKLGLEE